MYIHVVIHYILPGAPEYIDPVYKIMYVHVFTLCCRARAASPPPFQAETYIPTPHHLTTAQPPPSTTAHLPSGKKNLPERSPPFTRLRTEPCVPPSNQISPPFFLHPHCPCCHRQQERSKGWRRRLVQQHLQRPDHRSLFLYHEQAHTITYPLRFIYLYTVE